jgi:hypothetical protein
MRRTSVILVAGVLLGACDGEPPQAQREVCVDDQWREIPCHQTGLPPILHHTSPMRVHDTPDEPVTRGGFGKTGRLFTPQTSGG